MTESPNQPKPTSRLSKGLRTSVEIILVALFSLQTLCICVWLLTEFEADFFRLNTVLPLILFVSLGFTIFLVFRGRERLSSQSAKVSLGLILVLLATINSCFVVGIINFVLDDFLLRDSALYYILAVFMIGMLVSLWYFSYQKILSRSIVSIHAIVAVLFMVFFVFQYANVRKNQALILQAYYDYLPYRPTEGLSIYSVEYNFWSDEAYVITVSYPIPTFWNRPAEGVFYEFKFSNGQWRFTGNTGFYYTENF